MMLINNAKTFLLLKGMTINNISKYNKTQNIATFSKTVTDKTNLSQSTFINQGMHAYYSTAASRLDCDNNATIINDK